MNNPVFPKRPHRTRAMHTLMTAMAAASGGLAVPRVGRNDLVPPPVDPGDDELLAEAFDEATRQIQKIDEGHGPYGVFVERPRMRLAVPKPADPAKKAKRRAEKLARRKNRKR